jgi:hypothetical protein
MRVGTLIVSLGSFYTGRIIPAILLSIFVVLVNFYSLFLYVKISWKIQASCFEEMWKFTFGSSTVFIPSCCTIFIYGPLLTYYIGFIFEYAQALIMKISHHQAYIGLIHLFCV